MSSKSSAAIVGISIVLAAAIMTVPGLIEQRENDNLLSTTNGAVRLGKIYSEALRVQLNMSFTETGEEFLSVDAPADQVLKSASVKVKEMLRASNKEREKGEEVTYEEAGLKVHMTVKARTYVVYKSEYLPLYELTLDEHEVGAGVGANVSKTLQQAQEYADQVYQEFEEKHQLIKL